MVVDHLYLIDQKEDRVTISFLTNRMSCFVVAFAMFALCFAAVRIGFYIGWNVNIMAGVIGGSISLVTTTCFAVAEHITRYVITIEPDVISFQREFQAFRWVLEEFVLGLSSPISASIRVKTVTAPFQGSNGADFAFGRRANP